ncbi:MAG TPA: aminoglycoside phosphotransferase family protein, partial [Streptosporangiaceae bacterium]|nr:aminoglycoside phosphotransferase family protein [Streptosporangiaceae bacterium]
MHEYLRHLEAARFEGSPRVLGIDGDREMLTFIDGDVAADPQWQPGHGARLPPYAGTDLALRGAAELIRKLHQAAAGFWPANTSYRFHPYPPKAGEIVSHGDLGPWNTVYRHGIPVAFIDWDAA